MVAFVILPEITIQDDFNNTVIDPILGTGWRCTTEFTDSEAPITLGKSTTTTQAGRGVWETLVYRWGGERKYLL